MKVNILTALLMTMFLLSLSTCKTAQVVALTEVPEGVEPRSTLVLSRTSLLDLGSQEWIKLESGVIVRNDGDSIRLDIPAPLPIRVESTPAKQVDRSTTIKQKGENNQAIIAKRSEAQQGTGNVSGKRNESQAADGQGISQTSTEPAQASWWEKLRHGLQSFGLWVLLLLIVALILLRYLKKHVLP